MRTAVCIAFIGTLAILVGCVRSLHPIYTEDDLVFEPALVGEWHDEESENVFAFSKAGPKEYALTYTDEDGQEGEFSVRLADIGGKLFLDFFPAEPELQNTDFYKFHLLPVHTFAYVEQIEPSLRMSFPDPEWLQEYLEENPEALRHEVNDEIGGVVTAAPREQQAFWLKNLETAGAFGDALVLERKPSKGPEAPSDEPAKDDGQDAAA